jgi:hypothetical protein
MSLSPLAECLQGQAIAERDFIAGKIFLRYSSEVSERPQSRGCHIEQPGQSKQVTFSHSSHRFAADICCGHFAADMKKNSSDFHRFFHKLP